MQNKWVTAHNTGVSVVYLTFVHAHNLHCVATQDTNVCYEPTCMYI